MPAQDRPVRHQECRRHVAPSAQTGRDWLGDDASSVKAVKTLRLIRLTKLLRLARMQRIWERYELLFSWQVIPSLASATTPCGTTAPAMLLSRMT